MPDDLGSRLRALIKRKGFRSVSAAAKLAGISRSQLWDVISGRKSPSVETLERIVDALGATMRDLYCEEG